MSLKGVVAKVNRAEEDFHQLESEMFASPSNERYRAFVYQDPPSGKFRADIRIPVDGLTRWATNAGGVVRDLHAALDLLYCELVRKRKPRSKCTNAYFPICLRSEYVKYQQALVLRQVGKDVEAVLRGLQIPDADRWAYPLWILKRLAVRDKHREEWSVDFCFAELVQTPKPHVVLVDAIQIDEKVFYADNTRLLTIGLPPNVQVQTPPSVEVAVSQPLPGREPLVPLLNKVVYGTMGAIDALAPLLR